MARAQILRWTHLLVAQERPCGLWRGQCFVPFAGMGAQIGTQDVFSEEVLSYPSFQGISVDPTSVLPLLESFALFDDVCA